MHHRNSLSLIYPFSTRVISCQAAILLRDTPDFAAQNLHLHSCSVGLSLHQQSPMLWIFSLFTTLVFGLASVFLCHSEMVNGVYTFDSLQCGKLDEQDGWIPTPLYSKQGHLYVIETADTKHAKAITGTPGKTRYYHRKFRTQDRLPPFKNEERTLTIQFDIKTGGGSGTFYVGGEHSGVAIIWDDVIEVRANGITSKKPLLASATPPKVANGTWITLRLHIHDNTACLLWKRREETDRGFLPLAGAENFPVGNLLHTTDTWDHMGVAIGRAGCTEIDNLVPNASFFPASGHTP